MSNRGDAVRLGVLRSKLGTMWDLGPAGRDRFVYCREVARQGLPPDALDKLEARMRAQISERLPKAVVEEKGERRERITRGAAYVKVMVYFKLERSK